MYNVEYYDPRSNVKRKYLIMDVATPEEAEEHRKKFENKYVGKPYPNGKGWYPFIQPSVVKV